MPHREQASTVVAGHLCVDITPDFGSAPTEASTLFAPGRLTSVGPAQISTGGAVANTGLALSRLGVRPHLIGKVGDDLLGSLAQQILEEFDPAPTLDLIRADDGVTSYTLVISPPNTERYFLHCSGVNDQFLPNEIAGRLPERIRLFHFGYPPIMHGTYQDAGIELARLFQAVHERSGSVTLDMAMPDPNTDAGTMDWKHWLANVLPRVDAFMPSLDEMELMLGVDPTGTSVPQAEAVRALAESLLSLGTGAVMLKMGRHGLYLRTGSNLASMQRLFGENAESWIDREILAPSAASEVVNTTGAGDVAVAGFIAAVLNGESPEGAVDSATTAARLSIGRSDATSGVPTWDALRALRLQIVRPLDTFVPKGGFWNRSRTQWRLDRAYD